MTMHKALTDLLLNLFTATELRLLLRASPEWRRVEQELPGESVSPMELTAALAALVERRGRAGELLDLVEAARPERRDDVLVVRRLAGPERGAEPDPAAREAALNALREAGRRGVPDDHARARLVHVLCGFESRPERIRALSEMADLKDGPAHGMWGEVVRRLGNGRRVGFKVLGGRVGDG